MADIDPNVDPNANSGGADDGKGTGTEPPAGTATVSQEEFDKIRAKMIAADKRAGTAEKDAREKQAALDKIETDKLGDLEKAKKEATDAQALAAKQAEELKTTRLETAFIKASNGIKWHDVDTAYDALRKHHSAGVEIGDDGVVKGMEAAVKAMIKERAFLVNGAHIEPTPGASGESHNGRKGDTDEQKKAREAALKKRVPNAFRTR